MSAADIPSIMKKRSSGQYTDNDQGFVDLSSQFRQNNVAANVSSILQRKSDVSRAVDMGRHTIEPQDNGTKSLSIVKRAQVPSNQAVSVVSKQRMVGTSIFRPAHAEQVTDIATLESIKDISKSIKDIATASKTARPSKKRQQKPQKYPFEGPIYDAQYHEMVDDVVGKLESQKKFKTVEPKDARNLVNKGRQYKGQLRDDYTNEFASDKWGDDKDEFFNRRNEKKSREIRLTNEIDRLNKSVINDYKRANNTKEPSDFSAISDQKRQTKNQLVKRTRNNRNGDDWLIDAAFDQLVGVAKGAGEVAKVAGKAGKVIAREGFHATKAGIRAVGELAEEFEKTPMARNINRNIATENAHMRSGARRVRESIAGSNNIGNKRTRTAGSLVTQHNFGTTTTNNTVATSGATNQYGITGRYEYGNRTGKLELHYYYKGQRLTHEQASKILTVKQIQLIRQEAILGHNQTNGTSTTTAQANQSNNTGAIGTIVKKPAKTAAGLVKQNTGGLGNQGTKRTLNRPKTTTRSGLVHRNKSGVV